MSASDPTIDLMALADIAQPRKIAWEIHRQLRVQYGSVPHRVPLDGIARCVGVTEIAEHETRAFEGLLVVVGDKGAIGLRKGLTRGRRNFTVGHELGHFLNPWHRTRVTRFECKKIDLDASRSKGSPFDSRPPIEKMEVEANEFSAALLIPAPEYREERKRLGSDIDIGKLRELATTFDVSFEFMARTFVDTASDKLAIIISHNGAVSRVIPHPDFPYLGLLAGTPIPRTSVTHDYCQTHASGAVSTLREIGTSVWLEERGAVSALYEQVLVQREGWASTLLAIDEDEQDDEADDRNWNRRSGRFAR